MIRFPNTLLVATLLALALPATAQSLGDTGLFDRSAIESRSLDAAPMSRLPNGQNEPPPPPQTPPMVPVDGGLGLLALAGAGYAARKLRRG